MPVDMVSLESMLGWAIAIIAFLVGILLALLAFIFKTLKGDVAALGPQLKELLVRLARLVHKDECRDDMQAIRQHQDELDAQMDQLNTRVSHLEGSRKFVE